MGGLGERKWGRHRRLDRGARDQQARAHTGPDSHPRGQCRTQLPRVLGPVLVPSCILPMYLPSTPSQLMSPPSPSWLAQPRSCCRPRRRRPASLCCSLSASCTSASAAASNMAHVAGTCVARAHAWREIWHVAGCGAQSGAPSTSALAIMLNRFCTVDGPLSSPKRSKLVEEGPVGRVRSTRGAGGRQTLPTPLPIGTALAQAPDRSRRRPGAVLHCRTVDFLRKARN